MSVIRTKNPGERGGDDQHFLWRWSMGKKPLWTHSSHLFIPQMLKFCLDLNKACWSVHFPCVTLCDLYVILLTLYFLWKTNSECLSSEAVAWVLIIFFFLWVVPSEEIDLVRRPLHFASFCIFRSLFRFLPCTDIHTSQLTKDGSYLLLQTNTLNTDQTLGYWSQPPSTVSTQHTPSVSS